MKAELQWIRRSEATMRYSVAPAMDGCGAGVGSEQSNGPTEYPVNEQKDEKSDAPRGDSRHPD